MIRKADIKDIDQIMEMYSSCVKGMIEAGIDQWDDTYPNSEVIYKDIKKSTYYVKTMNSKIVGGVNIDQLQDKEYLDIKWEDQENLFLVVHRLAVSKEFWSKGIGKKLMTFTELLVKKKNLKSIRLDTYNTNPMAINFYQKLGYTKKGEIFLKPNKNEYYCFEKLIS